MNGVARNVWAFALNWPATALLTFFLLMAVPGLFSLPPMDRDESRFAQATVQMIETNNFVEVWFQDEPRNKKPAGIHWLQAFSVLTLSDVQSREIWAFRIPSLLGGALAVLLTFWGGRALFGRRSGFLGALFLASGLLFASQVSLATTDAMLLACVTSAQFSLGRVYLMSVEGSRARAFTSPGTLALIFWISLGAGILIKGPIAPLIAILTIVSLGIASRRWRWLRLLSPLPGVIILIVMTAPWANAIWDATNGEFFYQAISIEIWGKFTQAQELHSGPPGYHLSLLPFLLWPASLFLLPAATMAWRRRSRPEVMFCLAWIIPAWLVFELTTTKLPHYLLPTYPALSLLSAWAVFEVAKKAMALRDFGKPTLVRIWSSVWIVVGGLVAFAPLIALSTYADGPTLVALLLSLAVLALALGALRQSLNARPVLGAGLCLCAGVAAAVLWFEATLPNLDRLALTPRIAELVNRHDPGRTNAVALLGYSEPSIVFTLGTDTILSDPIAAADHLAARPGAMALVEERNKFEFFDEISRLRISVDEIESLEGFNYSNGKTLNLTLYRIAS